MPPKKPLKKLRTGALSRSFTLARLGLGAGARAAGSALGGLLDSEVAASARKKAHWIGQAGRLVAELGELKGSLMKAGQMLSVYGEHFFPPEVNELLRTLQSDSPPVDFPEIRKVLVKSLGAEKLKLLAIEEEPCGAASLGQVHRARVKATGEVLALKVQYPGVERAIDGDVKALKRVLALMDFLPKIPATDELFEEVRGMLKREVDYPLELKMLTYYGEKVAGDHRYVVPRPYPEFSGKRVLAMSFEAGSAIDGPEVAALSQARRNAIALSVLDLYFKELFSWRRVQTDPHFGNFRIRIGKTGDQLVMYDFGAVRDLEASFIEPYREMLRGTFHHDRALFERAGEKLKVLGADDPQELKNIFYELCRMITEPFLPPQPYDWSGTTLPQRLSKMGWEMIRKFPLRSPPPELVFLDRKMAGNFTLLAKLRAKIDGRALLESHLG
jgi:predicted unusual protein kinase regulating ubiquinone biosynthesis (AarF/ABC1/UbiB family)